MEQFPENECLGTRRKLDSKMEFNPRTKQEEMTQQFGEYEWMTFRQVKEQAMNLSHGIEERNLYNIVEDGDETLKIMGIMAPNCPEWLITDIACCFNNVTVAPLYTSLKGEQLSHVINLT